jgi:hypothetical protein
MELTVRKPPRPDALETASFKRESGELLMRRGVLRVPRNTAGLGTEYVRLQYFSEIVRRDCELLERLCSCLTLAVDG